jgi:5-methylthioadenosine/S-adenosylhomocysteine deaminase
VDEAFGAAFLDRATALIEGFHGSCGDRVRCQAAAHAPDNCSPAMLRAVRDLAERHGLTRTVHLSQSPGEVAAVKAAHNLTSAEYLDREDFLGPDLVAARTGPSAREATSACSREGRADGPYARQHLAAQLPQGPIGQIRDAGVKVVFGTDNMSEDMFQAMAFG